MVNIPTPLTPSLCSFAQPGGRCYCEARGGARQQGHQDDKPLREGGLAMGGHQLHCPRGEEGQRRQEGEKAAGVVVEGAGGGKGRGC